MRTFSVDEIMSMRGLYKDPPYLGFSLEEVLRRRAAAGSKLTRGDNAWSIRAPKNEDDGVIRTVRGALNKLAPEKYGEILETLSVPQLIASERAMQLVIDLVFKKALQEPGYSEMYARLCYDMALYEMSLQKLGVASPPSQATTPSGETKLSSKFRGHIIRSAQNEFQLTDPAEFADLKGEELEEAKSALIKRKKANMTFVGQLYIHTLLSPNVMLSIIRTVFRSGSATTQIPEEIDIEVLSALLETVGKSLDRPPNVAELDKFFERLEDLLEEGTYPMRTRFKIMNLVELRSNGWEPRVQRADTQAPTTLQEQQAKSGAPMALPPALKALGPRSPTVATPTSRRGGSSGGGMQRFPSTTFPDSPVPGPAPSLATWRTVSAPQARETPGCTPSDIGRRRGTARVDNKDLPFEKRVAAILTEWVNEASNERLPGNWRSRFKTSDWASEDEMDRALVCEVVREACITTKKDAQREACSFLRVALAFEPDDTAISQGLLDAFVHAVAEGIKEDVPKYYERFVSILHLVTEKDTIEELYCHASKLIYVVHNLVKDDNDECLSELLEVWRLLPRPGHSGEVLADNVVKFVVDLREADQSSIAAALVVSLKDSNLLSPTAIETWLKSTSAAQAPEVVALLNTYLSA